ncbi:glutamate--cysteine ligase catalytic subunit [Lingula anatina]|uniref:Glutamate--cysteine ligase n=1 Tax=Lingula anatina TaxID=7574 RepID=A0A1S3HC60_LINAN|nr:glutamate--cysteine ligase catalytic subunit [Lingula anatina]XP_013382743.1 glutamate--cysteine ligase catalytic subunit [Lingula anatina]XP_013382744.1 glutamate--cysteine ligase catalytic subunit [Lingula anatina]XP_013382745.1 glutamate--cysteine ligase catalytic subunit [Lingula anatina]|eukprot:XP_013382742.1 glutamate--cysteine ligase catalytic subunit [Lingula anatina]
MNGLEQDGERWLTSEEIADIWPKIRLNAVKEFIRVYHEDKGAEKRELLWGDETEYILVHFDHEKKTAKVLLESEELLEKLKTLDSNNLCPTMWQRECARFMVESKPAVPFSGDVESILSVEASMTQRRQLIFTSMGSLDKAVLTMGAYPRTGTPCFTRPAHAPNPTSGVRRSLFIPDEVIAGARYKAITLNAKLNMKGRRTEHIPIFKDAHTLDPFEEDLSQFGDKGKNKEDACTASKMCLDFGFCGTCCALQVTQQASDLYEARTIHDQLTPLCPILMALSAATPIHRGYLSNIDCRWPLFVQYTDEETQDNMWQKRSPSSPRTTKSRMDSVSCYAQPCNSCYNDGPTYMDNGIFETLLNHGVDEAMSRYVTNLFSRDPWALSDRQVHQCGEEWLDPIDLYTVVQANNYPSVRLKVPSQSNGWCVEFRPLDVQLTDFENASFSVFVVLLTRAILKYGLDLVLPISKVDKNMETASKRDAVRSSKFYFRDDIFDNKGLRHVSAQNGFRQISGMETNWAKFSLMTADEIVNGKHNGFPGLIPLVNRFLDDLDTIDVKTRLTADRYLDFIGKRASGETPTTARWMREFVMSHPAYKQDSEVSERINYDLMCRCNELSNTKPENWFWEQHILTN